jgi:hypothetical protein
MDELKLNKYLESFEVFHPLDGVLVINDVSLVHGDDEGKLRLVQDAARVQHVLKFEVKGNTFITRNRFSILLMKKFNFRTYIIKVLLRLSLNYNQLEHIYDRLKFLKFQSNRGLLRQCRLQKWRYWTFFCKGQKG